MTEELEVRRRRALYRAMHRGTKELDVMLGRFAAARIDTFDERDMAVFEQLLALPDPLLQSWMFANGERVTTEFAQWVADIRTFHGLDGRTAEQG